ncbi:MAG: ABC transporter ATP-binding protein, partial [Deltaproteobacteria bacterium]|nr:ABC transporter ATP-binding protein [Deltaproteobacteria bacterium]
MFEYGYIEDSQRRPYDVKLMFRLLKHVRPFLALLALTCLVILAATATDLVLPYLSKLAVDRCIVVSAQEVHSGAGFDANLLSVLEKYRPLLRPSGRIGLDYLSNERIKDVDPADLLKLKTAGMIKSEPYYLVDTTSESSRAVINLRPELFIVHPEVTAIHTSDLARLTSSELAELRSSDVEKLGQVALMCCLTLVLGYLFNLAHTVLLEYIGQKVSHDLRQTLMAHVIKQSIAFHDQTTTGRLVSRLTNDIQNLSEMIKSVAMTFFKDAVLLIGIIIVLLSIDLRLALITFALLPPIMLISVIFGRLARDIFRQLRTKIAEINVTVSETVAGIRVIQAFRRETVNQQLFDRINHDNYLIGWRQIKVFAVFMPMVDVMASTALALII